MAREGSVVTVIDQDENAFSALAEGTSASCFVGDPMTTDVMERAKAHDADVLIAATPKDELNVAISVVAQRLFHIKYAIARVRDPKRADSCTHLGVEIICPTILEAAIIARQVDGMKSQHPMRIVVVGCGWLSCHVVNLLNQAGHHIVVIDHRASSFENLGEGFGGARVQGDATEPSVLERAQAREADLVIAATRSDNVNLMVALIAKEILSVKDVIARVHDPRREAIFHDVATVSATGISANAILAIVGRWVRLGEPSPR
jgi:trk system potassium uptake protein TrkA